MQCIASFQVSANGGLVSSLLCCGGLEMSADLNVWVKNKSFSLLSDVSSQWLDHIWLMAGNSFTVTGTLVYSYFL